jgi:hypothetical protein
MAVFNVVYEGNFLVQPIKTDVPTGFGGKGFACPNT